MTAGDARHWPTWGPHEEVQGLNPYAALARYVSPLAVDQAPRLKVTRPDPDDGSAAADRALAQALYTRLAGQGLGYALHPRIPRGFDRQQIRHPAWLVNVGWGTCLDLAVTYASMCWSEHLAPLLILSQSHALVALTPGRTAPPTRKPAGPLSLPGCTALRTDLPGVLRVQDPTGFLDGLGDALLPVECTSAVTRTTPAGPAEPLGFDDALLAGRAAIAKALAGTAPDGPPRLWIVDVAWLHETPRPHGGVRPLKPPDSERDIQLHLPQGVVQGELNGEQHALFKRVRDGRRPDDGGIHVIAAPPGYGKSTIARRLVLEAPFGAGWFLGASDERVLTNSLAEAELRSQNRAGVELSDLDRGGYAESAVGRLRDTRHPWLVVLDNADHKPADAVRRLPAPRAEHGQVIVVTTTDLGWAETSGHCVHHLEPLTPDELHRRLANSELERLSAGRWLVVAAFERLAAGLRISTSDLVVPPSDDDRVDGDRGVQAYWSMACNLALSPEAQRAARLAALLAPDGLSVEALDAVHPEAASDLRRIGLIEYVDGAAHGRMHRLVRRTIQEQVDPERGAPERIAVALTRSPVACDNLAEFGDAATVQHILDLLKRVDHPATGPERDLGQALHALGRVLELRNLIKLSADAFHRARRHLDLTLAEDRFRDAECLLGMAREKHQFGRTPEDFSDGIAWTDEGYALMVSDGLEARAGRWLAMRGLLMKELANRPGLRGSEAIEKYKAAIEVIEEADRLRRADPTTPPEELARSRFNFAGPEIGLAKRRRDHAAEHLDRAMAVYSTVLEQRRQFYPHLEAHGHIAACIAGLATVEYFRAMLLDLERPERARRLRAATRHAIEAMRQRELLAGEHDNEDVEKSHRLMAKISLARYLVRTNKPDKALLDYAKLLLEVTDELRWGRFLEG